MIYDERDPALVDNIEHVNWRGGEDPHLQPWMSYLIITSHCHQSQSRLETWFQPFAHLVAVRRASCELWGAWYQWQLNMDLLRVSLVLQPTVWCSVVWWWWDGATQQSGLWWVQRHQVWWWWCNEERPVPELSLHYMTDWLVYCGPCTEHHIRSHPGRPIAQSDLLVVAVAAQQEVELQTANCGQNFHLIGLTFKYLTQDNYHRKKGHLFWC